MRFIQLLSSETVSLLRRIYRQSKQAQVRQRTHCILLSNGGFTIAQLMKIFQVSRKTIYNWFTAWEERSLVGLYDRPGRGRKPIFTAEQREQIHRWAQETPKNLNQVLNKIKKTWKLTVSKDTVKRILKGFSMSWRRLRRVLGGSPDPQEYERKERQLEGLKALDDQGIINLVYMDESGFCLTPYVPYAWQDKGETLGLKSQKSKRLNVLGFMHRRQTVDSYIFEQSITSDVVIACIDEFCKSCQRITVIVLDQASIHTSAIVQEKETEWSENNVVLFWLPTYSPELNLIEILWRFMKYEWIELSVYESWITLVKYVEKVLVGFGNEYVINFA